MPDRYNDCVTGEILSRKISSPLLKTPVPHIRAFANTFQEIPNRIPLTTRLYNRIKSRVRGAEPTALAWSTDADRAICAYSNGEIATFNSSNLEIDEVKRIAKVFTMITAITPIPEQQRILVGDVDGTIHITTASLLPVHNIVSPAREIVVAIATSGDHAACAVKNAYPSLISTSTFEQVRSLKGLDFSTSTLDWHPRKSLLVAGSRSQEIQLWDPRLENSTIYAGYLHKEAILQVAWNPLNDCVFMSLGSNNVINVWDIRVRGPDWKPLYTITRDPPRVGCSYHALARFDFESAAYDRDTSKDVALCPWCCSNGAMFKAQDAFGSSNTFTTAAWNPTDPSLLSVGDTGGVIRFYDTSDYLAAVHHSINVVDQEFWFNTPVKCLQWEPRGKTLMSATGNNQHRAGSIAFWKMPLAWGSVCDIYQCAHPCHDGPI